MNIMDKVSKRVILLREEKGETQQELADAIGITRQSLSRYELAMRTVNVDVLAALAQHFGVSSDYLLGLSDVKSTEQDVQTTCEVTGLSEEAVIYLQETQMKKKSKQTLHALSEMISDTNLFFVLEQICESARKESEQFDFYNAAFDFFAKSLSLDLCDRDKDFIINEVQLKREQRANRQKNDIYYNCSMEKRIALYEVATLFDSFVLKIYLANYKITEQEFEILGSANKDYDYVRYKINKEMQDVCDELVYEMFEPEEPNRQEILRNMFEREQAIFAEIIEKIKETKDFRQIQEVLHNAKHHETDE